ncbi:hypothetical protein OPV22_015001 [Ensete ventricosum]|uniref:SBP-type domain-containing protein n=1 Tax=Ensete ventricosum TaxID=4639 RepID=A0AAV8R8V8_ENSVE|nr:hypothetical protein OPV22_015001 [Ensete ventricosum]
MAGAVGGDRKRARKARATPVAALRCQVPGCEAGIEDIKGYHRRHRVCLRCACAPCVVLDGQSKRHCQQCGKFHMLSDFDVGTPGSSIFLLASCCLELHETQKKKSFLSFAASNEPQNEEKDDNPKSLFPPPSVTVRALIRLCVPLVMYHSNFMIGISQRFLYNLDTKFSSGWRISCGRRSKAFDEHQDGGASSQASLCLSHYFLGWPTGGVHCLWHQSESGEIEVSCIFRREVSGIKLMSCHITWESDVFGPAFLEVENELGVSNFIPILFGSKLIWSEFGRISRAIFDSCCSDGIYRTTTIDATSYSGNSFISKQIGIPALLLDIAWALHEPGLEKRVLLSSTNIHRPVNLLKFLLQIESLILMEVVLHYVDGINSLSLHEVNYHLRW